MVKSLLDFRKNRLSYFREPKSLLVDVFDN
nr:MAG TPA: hypothetical protein [Caudoviricetes sp.]